MTIGTIRYSIIWSRLWQIRLSHLASGRAPPTSFEKASTNSLSQVHTNCQAISKNPIQPKTKANFIRLELVEKSMIESTIKNVSLMIAPCPAQVTMTKRLRLLRRTRVPLLVYLAASLVNVSLLLYLRTSCANFALLSLSSHRRQSS